MPLLAGYVTQRKSSSSNSARRLLAALGGQPCTPPRPQQAHSEAKQSNSTAHTRPRCICPPPFTPLPGAPSQVPLPSLGHYLLPPPIAETRLYRPVHPTLPLPTPCQAPPRCTPPPPGPRPQPHLQNMFPSPPSLGPPPHSQTHTNRPAWLTPGAPSATPRCSVAASAEAARLLAGKATKRGGPLLWPSCPPPLEGKKANKAAATRYSFRFHAGRHTCGVWDGGDGGGREGKQPACDAHAYYIHKQVCMGGPRGVCPPRSHTVDCRAKPKHEGAASAIVLSQAQASSPMQAAFTRAREGGARARHARTSPVPRATQQTYAHARARCVVFLTPATYVQAHTTPASGSAPASTANILPPRRLSVPIVRHD